MELLLPIERMFRLLFPNLCLACQKVLPQSDRHWCLACQRKLPFTDLHQDRDNMFVQRLWGRISLEAGAACFYFVKGGQVQAMLHALKYEGRRELGTQLGRMYARRLQNHPVFPNVDLLVPVPLHWKKKRLRGYNQAELIARGLGEIWQKPVLADGLQRVRHQTSLTQKSRLERLESMLSAFAVKHPRRLSGRHILLVDDVLTSGATLEACALPILELPDTKVSMLTLAIAV